MPRVPTSPIAGQKPGTSGLRKKTREFVQPGYIENFVQSILDVVREDTPGPIALAVGGDGRYFNKEAIATIVKLAHGNGVARIFVAKDGILSTPAMSAVIRARGLTGGIVLSASHNPGGIDADFGIKYNASNGGPAPEDITDRIFKHTQTISEYFVADNGTEVVELDPLEDYVALLQQIFDFDRLREFLKSGFRLCFDAMNGVTGPYAHRIFEDLLGAPKGSVLRGTPLEDFGGEHPDPNLTYAADLVAKLASTNAPDFGAACDGDGDRNLILGRKCFVSPGDSLAVIADLAPAAIPAYSGGLAGIARSMPTSMAADRVAASLGIPCFETPTGWKFFGSLLDAGKITICGEESFGTGSNHIREKDGLWAVLAWLSILAHTGKSVDQVLRDHWTKFGRSYYQRHDYEGVSADAANQMLADVRGGTQFSYSDPVNGSITSNQGLQLYPEKDARVILRLSGTGTEGATLRMYFESYSKEEIALDPSERLAPLVKKVGDLLEIEKRLGRSEPDVIT
jgi:phosphoglucomutase